MDRDSLGSSHPFTAAMLTALLASVCMSCAVTGQTPELSASHPAGIAAPMPDRSLPGDRATPAEPAAAALPPLDLATVHRLVDQQNAPVAVARSRVHEAQVEKCVADQRCLGTAKQLEAEGKVWQQRLEESRVTSETLLDALSTYVDLLAARSGEAIAVDLQKRLQELLGRAEKLAEKERGVQVEVKRIQVQLSTQQRALLELRQQAAAASAKLAYALGLDPETKFVLMYDRLMPFDVVEARPPARELIARAWATGPGIREMEGLIAFLDRSIAQASSTSPLLQALAPHLRGRICVVRAKLQTTLIAHQDLRGKLAAGVLEAREAILSGREQIRLAEEGLAHAERAYELSNERSKEFIEGSSFSEVVLSLTNLSFAQAGHINALRSHNRAQLRLWVLLGRDRSTSGGSSAAASPAPDRDCPIPHGGPQ